MNKKLFLIFINVFFLFIFSKSFSYETKFRFPGRNPGGKLFISNPVFHVDHDPNVYDGIAEIICTDYKGDNFPQCYDEHRGSDFLLQGGFEQMDNGSAEVVAAAEGIVIYMEDGNYDHCHGDPKTLDVSCDGYPMKANKVIILHKDGLTSHYHHFMKDSIVVKVGDYVECGQKLGLVGSSGYSTVPHIHFEVQTPEGEIIDPFNLDLKQSYWLIQDGPYLLPAEFCPNSIDTDNDKIPDELDNCPNLPNILQRDKDGDGIGDECEKGCGILNDVIYSNLSISIIMCLLIIFYIIGVRKPINLSN